MIYDLNIRAERPLGKLTNPEIVLDKDPFNDYMIVAKGEMSFS